MIQSVRNIMIDGQSRNNLDLYYLVMVDAYQIASPTLEFSNHDRDGAARFLFAISVGGAKVPAEYLRVLYLFFYITLKKEDQKHI